jgi:SAM-dependent methyltransferase
MSAHPARVWALGDYPAIARDVLAPLGPELVAACGVGPGMRVLDVGAGTGNAAIAAALTGADVVALDPVPELIEAGRAEAAARGAAPEWVVGDAQALPQGDAEFDVVLSCLGAMFAPDHAATASELTRVCRRGGLIGLVAWHPPGLAAELMRVVGRHAPPPPPGAGSPVAWGDEDHLRGLFGDRVTDIVSHVGLLHTKAYADPDEAAAFYCRSFSPAVALAARLPPDAVAALHADIGDWARRAFRDGGLEFEYVLTVARRAG